MRKRGKEGTKNGSGGGICASSRVPWVLSISVDSVYPRHAGWRDAVQARESTADRSGLV